MGFDYIDDSRSYSDFLRGIEPKGPSSFKLAYAYGLGMILDFNSEYTSEPGIEIDSFKKPQYLHLVLSTDTETLEQQMVN